MVTSGSLGQGSSLEDAGTPGKHCEWAAENERGSEEQSEECVYTKNEDGECDGYVHSRIKMVSVRG